MENYQSMRNPAKAILVAILIAIPAPFIIGLLLSATPEPLRLLAIGEGLEALGSTGGLAAYLIAFVIFAIAGFVAIALSAKQPAAAPTRRRWPAAYGRRC
jgi:CspA family cold shock protein